MRDSRISRLVVHRFDPAQLEMSARGRTIAAARRDGRTTDATASVRGELNDHRVAEYPPRGAFREHRAERP